MYDDPRTNLRLVRGFKIKKSVLVQRYKQPLSRLESKEEPSKLDCDQQLHHHPVEMMLLVGSETGDLREPHP